MYKNQPGLKLSFKLSAIALWAVGSLLVFGLFHPFNSQAAAGINQQLNFQGRLLDNTGAVVADGSYNMEFKIYQDGTGCVSGGSSPCSGTLKWTEDWIQTNRITVKNGYFSVNLDAICASWTGACASNGGIDWNQDTLWLSTNIGGVTNTPTPTWDGEMTPFKRLASSPYSLNSNALQGLQAANFVQLAKGVQADASTTAPSIFINKTNASGTPNILELQKSNTDVLVVDNSGGAAFTPQSTGNITVTGDNDSNVAISSTFTGTGPNQSALVITLTDNATAAGTSYGLSIINADNTTNLGVPAALAYLNNANAAEVVSDGLLVEQTGAGTLTSGLEVKQTTGVVTNGLTFTGTFSKLINSTNFNVTGAGAGTFGSTLIVNGTTFTLGNGASSTINTPSGNAGLSIIPNGSGALNLATTNTGNVAVGNSTGTFSLTSSGGLNVTTGGALTGVASLDTINTSATALTFAGSGTVSSGTGSDVALGNQIALRPGVDSTNGLTIQNAGATATIASFGTNTSNPNLIANPSLEANANGWTKKGNVSVTATSSDDFAQYGTRALKIVTTATAADGASYSVPLKASTQYTLSAWIRISTGTASTINLNRQDNGTDVDAGTGNCTALSVSTTFAQYSCTFTTGATVNGTTNVYVKQTDAPVGGRTIYVDGVTLVAAGSGLTYDAGGSGFNLQTINSGLTLNGIDSGDVQPWQLSPSPLTTALRYGDGVQANGYIYYVGGCTGACGAGTSVATVYYAKMNADGSMGVWSAATSIPAARYGLTTYAINGYLYAVGGDSGAGVFGANPQTTIYYSKLNSDGTVGTWQTSVNVLPAAREFHTSAVIDGFAYVIGGDNAGAQSTAYYAKMYADGSNSAWTTTTPLTTGAATRRDASTIIANGFIYVIGGDTGGTAQNTVYYNSINSDGTLGSSWSSTTAISVGGAQNRRYLTSVVANGYVYAIGGDNGTTAQSTVYFAHLLPDGTIGAWQSASNPLPTGRYGSISVIVNGYIYEIGGYDGTAAAATPYYASTARVLIGGSLDLVGLGGGTISAPAGAGSITAGNIRAVGGLTVDGTGDFNNGISVDSVINLNAVSASAGQTVFNINNLNSNSIFSVRHMNTNFGALATTGAFMSKNSYFGEEYNIGHNNTCNVTGTIASTVQEYARGDGGNVASTTACSGASNTLISAGELNFSTVLGATAGICNVASPGITTANGVEQITATSTNASGNKALCAENIAGTATTSNKIFTATNLPVVEMKVKPTTVAANNSSVVAVGMSADNVAATANVLPLTGLFFTNCSTYSATAPSGCSNTTWYGMAAGTGTQIGSTLTCTGAMSSSFAYLRIEVRALNDVHFFADVNTTDGISETECGSGITTNVNSGAMSMWLGANFLAASANSTVLQIDYFRSWQDDNVGLSDDVLNSASETQADNLVSPSTLPLTPVNTEMDGSKSDETANPFSTLTDFVAATTEDTIFNNNIYVKGTIYANKIVANQIEGIDVITDQIKSLSDELAKQQTANPATTKTGLSGAGGGNGKVSFTTVSAVNLTVLAQIETKGGLVVDGDAQFNGKTLFQLAAEFNGPANFNGQVTFNSDAGGTVIIKNGDQKITVKFSKAYTSKPVIIANWLLDDTKDAQGNIDTSDAKQQRLFDGGYSYSVANVTTKGFDIVLNKKASEDVELSWIANAIKNSQLSQSSQGSSL